MCHLCHPSTPRVETRRSFVRKITGAAAVASMAGTAHLFAQEPTPRSAQPSGGWARLITPNREWDFHSEREAKLLDYMQADPELKFNGRYFHADPASLEQLCKSPFLFSFDMTMIKSAREWDNIREYLYRGGFLYLDNCVHVTPNIREFRKGHLERLAKLLPASEWRRLSADHPIYRARYPVKVDDLPADRNTPADEHRAYYGVFDDNRMIALVSLAHLFCGWPERPHIVGTCMQQISNIYLYARTH